MKKFRRLIAACLSVLMVFQINMVSSASTGPFKFPSFSSFSSLLSSSPEETLLAKEPAPAFNIATPSYLTFTGNHPFSISTGVESWDGYIYYSTDTVNWSLWSPGVTSIIYSTDTSPYKLYICGTDNSILVNPASEVTLMESNWQIGSKNGDTDQWIDCTGNINSLLDCRLSPPDKYGLYQEEQPEMDSYCFAGLFTNNPYLRTAPDMPSKVLSDHCYFGLFAGCTQLINVPDLPAAKAAEECYSMMFAMCFSLQSPPGIMLTETAPGCCESMFLECSSLKCTPKLRSKLLADSCYKTMFSGCSELVNINSIYASTLNNNCCSAMFSGCSNLKLVKSTDKLQLKEYKPWGVYKTDSFSFAFSSDDDWNTGMFDGFEPDLDETYYLEASPLNITTSINDNVSGTINGVSTSATNTNYMYDHISKNDLYDPVSETVFGSTIDIGDMTYTALKNDDNAQYTFSFDGWELVSALPKYLTADLSLNAKFSKVINKYDVTIDTNNPEYLDEALPQDPITVEYGTKITADKKALTIGEGAGVKVINAKVKSDDAQYKYSFSWDNVPVDPEYVTGDITITANVTRETKKYDVNVNVDSDSVGYGTVSQSSISGIEYGTALISSGNTLSIGGITVTATPASDSAQYSYKFDHWEIPASTVTGTTNIKAFFSRSVNQYTVSVLTNNSSYGTVSTSEVKADYGTPVAANGSVLNIGSTLINATPATSTAEYIYSFDKWTGLRTAVNDSHSVTANFIRTVKKYTVTYNSNGHGTDPSSQTVPVGESVPRPGDLVAAGYAFTGWFTSQVCAPGYLWDFETGKMPSSDLTLYAGWKVNSYTVTFNANGHGSAPEPITAAFGSKITKPSDPSATGYSFNGWYTDPSCTSTSKWNFDVNTVPASNITLYAGWSVSSYTVTFDANGHGSAPEPITAAFGSKITKPTDPSATGYSFNGWYTDPSCTAASKWNFDANTVPASNIKLYAGWSVSSYTVTFDANGHGTAPEPITAAFGSKITKPTDPSASNYSFNGWYTDTSCTAANKWDFDVNTMPASDLTLYASWTYNGSGGGGSGGGGGGGGGSASSAVRSLNTLPTFSDFWVVDAKGVWRCFNPSTGQFVSSSWLCDDAITANGKNVWYLMNTDGTMLAANLVRDNSGNYYSLETSHYGYFGSLRYVNGTYDGIYMEFSQKHDGTFGAITNKEAIEALKAKYGVTEFKIGNENSVYTSTFPKS